LARIGAAIGVVLISVIALFGARILEAISTDIVLAGITAAIII
jgi:hypothetical protein